MLYTINYDNDLIRGSDTRNMLASLIGKKGYISTGSIIIDPQINDNVIVKNDFCAFVGGLFVQNLIDQTFEMESNTFLVVETSFLGDVFTTELKVVTEIDASLVNGIKKHFVFYKRDENGYSHVDYISGFSEEIDNIKFTWLDAITLNVANWVENTRTDVKWRNAANEMIFPLYMNEISIIGMLPTTKVHPGYSTDEERSKLLGEVTSDVNKLVFYSKEEIPSTDIVFEGGQVYVK